MLEDAVSETMTGDVGRGAARGHRGGGPDPAVLLVTKVEGLAAGVLVGIVVPGRQPVAVGVLAPGVGAATLADDAAEPGVRQHVHPRRGRALLCRGGVVVFVSCFFFSSVA